MENKVSKATMSTLPKIVAVDFDGTLVEDKFPEIGRPRVNMIQAVKQLQAAGVRVVLWTCRDHDSLKTAVDWCKEKHGLIFDAVNENVAEVQQMFNNDTRKVYADLYIDDKASSFMSNPYEWAERLGMQYRKMEGFINAI